MGVLPTAAPNGAPANFHRSFAAENAGAGPPHVSSVQLLGLSPPARKSGHAPPAPPLPSDGWRERELVGEYYAFIGDRLKARHQKNRALAGTVDGFRRSEWSEAAERAFEGGRPAPPTLDLSPAELHHLASVRGYKDRCAFYTAKLDRILEAVGELTAEAATAIQPEVVAWR